jgi:SAM-dependent methyltransferase
VIRDQRRYWDDAAWAFDREPDHGLGDPSTRAAWRALLVGMLPSSPASVLDVGCGTGTLSVLLAEAGYRVHGIDLSPRMLDQAVAKAAAAGVPVSFAEGDGAEPDVERSSIDVVLCRHALWAMPSASAAVASWRQTLRDGGRFVLIEGVWDTGGGLASEEVVALLRPHTTDVDVIPLFDTSLWGRSISDERYAVVALI